MRLKSTKLLKLSLFRVVLIKRMSLLAALTILGCSLSIRPAFAVTAAVPTAGLAITSVAVGAAGVLGGGWFTRLTGYAVGLVDPTPATFYQGKIVMKYPENLLTFAGVGWFGNFAADPGLPVPPVVPDPFFEFDLATTPYNYQQGPNPVIGATVNASGGVVTVQFDASPGGVTVADGAHFNLLGILFQNTSGSDLAWQQAPPAGPANFFSNSPQQVLTCRPDPNLLTPVSCGMDTPSFTYVVSVAQVPEPGTLWLLVIALMSPIVSRRGRNKLVAR